MTGVGAGRKLIEEGNAKYGKLIVLSMLIDAKLL
jgi:hypothetical protein